MVLSSFVIRECEESKRFKTYTIITHTESSATKIIERACEVMMLGDMLVKNSIYTITREYKGPAEWGVPYFHGWTDNKTLDELFLNEKPELYYIKKN